MRRSVCESVAMVRLATIYRPLATATRSDAAAAIQIADVRKKQKSPGVHAVSYLAGLSIIYKNLSIDS